MEGMGSSHHVGNTDTARGGKMSDENQRGKDEDYGTSGKIVCAAPVSDQLEASRVWRESKLERFRSEVRRYRERLEEKTKLRNKTKDETDKGDKTNVCHSNGAEEAEYRRLHEMERALEEVERASAELTKLADKQSNDADAVPWWADGQYDKQKADARNDDGISLLKDDQFGCAFDAFTDAIYLYPSVAVYHSNRAVCML